MVISNSSWDYFWVRLIETREILESFWLRQNNFDIGTHLDTYKPIGFKLGMMILTIVLYIHFDASLIGLDIDSRSKECEKAKSSEQIIWQKFQSV